MSISTVTTNDDIVNYNLSLIRTAKNGRDARQAIANSVDRCYYWAIRRAGTTGSNRVPQSKIDEHNNRIKTAIYGEEVRDALKTCIQLCYQARGKSVPNAENTNLTNLINVQIGEDLKNAILNSIARCCQDVRT